MLPTDIYSSPDAGQASDSADRLAEPAASIFTKNVSPPADASPAPKARNFSKKVNRKYRKSPYRDSRFLESDQPLNDSAEIPEARGTSVIQDSESPSSETNDSKPTDSSSLHSLSPTALSPTDDSTDTNDSESASPLTPKAARHWRPYQIPVELLPVSYRKPAPWRDLSDPARLHHLHKAIGGRSIAFTANLSPEIEQQARKQASPLEWLYRRVARELKAAGLSDAFYMVLEDSEDRRLHIHGEIDLDPSRAPQLRSALRKAAGEWEHTRQHQTHTYANPDDGWPAYLSKRAPYQTATARKILEGSRMAPSFTGPWIAASHALKRKAAALYEANRKKSTPNMASTSCE